MIGADSGGPRDFVTSEVGTLVPETDDRTALAAALAEAINRALDADWKTHPRTCGRALCAQPVQRDRPGLPPARRRRPSDQLTAVRSATDAVSHVRGPRRIHDLQRTLHAGLAEPDTLPGVSDAAPRRPDRERGEFIDAQALSPEGTYVRYGGPARRR